VHGYSKQTGHHTPLFSTPQQIESTDHAVKMLLQKGVAANQLVIGSGFYGSLFQVENQYLVELYQPAKFIGMLNYKTYRDSILNNGYELK
jgi:chitinase